ETSRDIAARILEDLHLARRNPKKWTVVIVNYEVQVYVDGSEIWKNYIRHLKVESQIYNFNQVETIPLIHLLYEDFCNLYIYTPHKVYFQHNRDIFDHNTFRQTGIALELIFEARTFLDNLHEIDGSINSGWCAIGGSIVRGRDSEQQSTVNPGTG
ncbi:hypothetical protein ALC56_06545, partial [Trachymyrmex septentrionalis]